jgi:hypothetical protein
MPADPAADLVQLATTLLTALALSAGALWYGALQKRA